MKPVTNAQRAHYAAQAIERYNEAVNGSAVPYDTIETVVTDLLCDLMHYAKRQEFDLETLFGQAQSHFQDEEMERHIDLVHELPYFVDAMKKARDELLFQQKSGARGTDDTETRAALQLLTQAIAKAEGDA